MPGKDFQTKALADEEDGQVADEGEDSFSILGKDAKTRSCEDEGGESRVVEEALIGYDDDVREHFVA